MTRWLAILACVMCAAVPAAASPAAPVRSVGTITDQCRHWQDHVAEACAAYIFWDAHGALQPYYKYYRSYSFLSGFKNIFPHRYKGTAPATIRSWAKMAGWPTGTNDVDGPDISIIDAKSSLACNRAVLVTKEYWKVTSKATGKVLYKEPGVVHTVVLRRVPGEIFVLDGKSLHAWDVYAIYKGRRQLSIC